MGLTEFLHHSMEWIEQSGWIGVGWFIVLYTLTCVFFLPGSVLTVGAGAVYGFWFSTGSGHHQFDRRSRGQFSYKPISGAELDAEEARSQRKIPSFGESCQRGRLAHDPDQPYVADRAA